MFPLPWQFILLILVFRIAIGSVIGAGESAILYRSRLKTGVLLINMGLGALGYLVGGYLAGWGDSHSYTYNGVRMDVSADGENLWLRNRLVEHELLISVAIPTLLILIAYAIVRFSMRRAPSRLQSESSDGH